MVKKIFLLACLFSLLFTLPALAADNPGTFGSSGTVPFISADTATDGTAATALGVQVNGTEMMRVTATGSVGIGTTSPQATLDVNGSISSQGPAGEASLSSFSVPTGGTTLLTNFTTNYFVGSGFDATTGSFTPSVAGRYLFVMTAQSGGSQTFLASISKNKVRNMLGGSALVNGCCYFASATAIFYLNGSTDTVYPGIANYSGSTLTGSSVFFQWSKLP